MNIKKQIKWQIRKFLIDHYPKMIIDHEWPGQFGRKIDWKNPRDINEKIQWLISYSDISEWTRLADKYRVREFVKERGLEHLLVELYGVWENAEDIDYDALPNKFVLKCNHDSGSVFIIDKAKGYDRNKINNELNDILKRKFGYLGCEPHYNRIKPCIIAEEFLEDRGNSFSKTLVDYKVWAFNGKVKSFWVCYNRSKDAVFVNIYDTDWNYHPECTVQTNHYRDGGGIVPRPQKLNDMISAASILSKGFPQVRVDFYEVNGVLYFGEMTFSSIGGRMDVYTKEYLAELGQEVVLPKKKSPFKL